MQNPFVGKKLGTHVGCPSCGKTVRVGDARCQRCGTHFSEATGFKTAAAPPDLVTPSVGRGRWRAVAYLFVGLISLGVLLAVVGSFLPTPQGDGARFRSVTPRPTNWNDMNANEQAQWLCSNDPQDCPKTTSATRSTQTPSVAPVAPQEAAAASTGSGGLQALPDLSKGIVIQAEASLRPDGRAVISGRTNLPEGESLMFSVRRLGERREAQSSGEITNGKFESEPLGSNVGLEAGQYHASVTLPYTHLPPHAPRVISEKGAPVRGATVTQNSLGTAASVTVPFRVGSKREAAQVDAEQSRDRMDAGEIRREMQNLVVLGRQMASLRGDRHDLAKSERCGGLMRKRQALVDQLEGRAKLLPSDLRQPLLGITGVLSLCVSCSQGLAPDSCATADEVLRDMYKAR